ncbi:ABC transporter ATP-binding protein [Patescibacteria group bacterium]|nr:ABC transporter ATP-binding protein [Patescibacteria group bacterium]
MAKVKLVNVTKEFGRAVAVSNMSLSIEDAEFVTLVGPSGCGKTTTLRLIAGLEEVGKGEIYIGDRLVNDVSPKNRGISMVFQSYALFPHMSVAANIAFGLKIAKVPREEILDKVKWALELLDLEGLDERRPRELSGGQRQRVALGRALVLDPQVLLLDEPLSNLDAKLRLRMRAELKRIHRKIKQTILYVTHDQVEAMSMSDKIAIMDRGVLMQVGPPLEVYNNPRSKFVAGFIGSPPMNFIPAKLLQEDRRILVDTGDFCIPIPTSKKTDKLKRKIGKEVIFGIRPENIYYESSTKPAPPEYKVNAIVDIIEPMGYELIICLTTGKHLLQAVMDSDTEIEVDQKIKVIIDMHKAHLFDRETEQAIY